MYIRGELHWVSASQEAGKKAYCYEDFTEIRYHRISTARKEKGWGRLFFPQIEPIWPLPYSTVPVPQLRDVRPAGWVTLDSPIAVYAELWAKPILTILGGLQKYETKLNSKFLSLVIVLWRKLNIFANFQKIFKVSVIFWKWKLEKLKVANFLELGS